MNDPFRRTADRPGRGLKRVIAFCGTVGVIAVALVLARPMLTVSPAAADEPKGKAEKKAVAPTPKAVEAANAFLDSLDDTLRKQAVLDYASPKKPNWSNLPVTMVERNGVKLGDLSKEQREKALAVVAALLSRDGYRKVLDIMDADQTLVRGGGGRPMFGKDLYYLAVFGTPSETEPWLVQFGGHHLGVNVTVVGKHFVLTPTHTGTQPALFKRDGKDVRPLAAEADTAFKLLTDLDERQRKQAVIGDKPQGELVLGPGKDGKAVDAKGLRGDALTKGQKALLLDVIAAWVNIVESDTAAARLAAIKEKLDATHFAWSGPTDKAGAGYFRVQGPTIVIEYAPQGGTDHVHTVVRNPEDEYGVGSSKK